MMVVLYRRQEDDSVRYVTMHDRQGNLFGYPTLTVTSGSTLATGRTRHYTFESSHRLISDVRARIERRLGEGYVVLYAWASPGDQPQFVRLFNEIAPMPDKAADHSDGSGATGA